MSITIRETLVGKAVGYLSAPTAGGKNPPDKPERLTVHCERFRPLEQETLPAILLYFEDDKPDTINSKYVAPLVKRYLTLAMVQRAQGSQDVSPDRAIEPLYLWGIYRLFENERFDGFVNRIEEGRTEWRAREGDIPIAQATTHLVIEYRTSRIDPSSRS